MPPFKPRNISDFPAYFWHPETCEKRVFEKAEDVPEGWLNHYPTPVDPNPVEPPKAPPPAVMTRKEVIAALVEGGLDFPKNAPTPQLIEQLRESVIFTLTEQHIPFDKTATVKELYELLKKE